MKKIILLLSVIVSFSCGDKEKKQTPQNAPDSNIAAKQLTTVKLSSGTLERVENFPSQFVKPRHVDIWLPEGYSKDKTYAVLYMHDGQMLFDATNTWNKQEWQVDEVATQLIKTAKVNDFIVVAMWNIPEIRWQDYYPEKSWDFIPKETQKALGEKAKSTRYHAEFHADNYLKFITEEVKPFIDRNYSVYKDQTHTFIAGSSMGGLISMYAIFEYPEVFGGAACLSTHWTGTVPSESEEENPVAQGFFDYMKSKTLNPQTHSMYFDYGTQTLDADYIQYASTVDQIFKDKGFDNSNFRNLKFEGAAHDEVSWAKRLDVPLTFLLKK